MKSNLIRSGIVFAALIAAPVAALAADLPTPSYKAPAYVAPSYSNWSGFYIGLNAGYGFGTSTWDVPALSLKPKGVLAGAQLGYNFQTGVWVWGVEGDIDYSGMKASATCFGAGTCETKNTWLGTARARLGYGGWGSFMPYITGGGAFGSVKATSPFGSATSTRFGWTAGLGLEYAFLNNFSVKVEYLYADLGKFDCAASCSGGGADNVSFKTNIVRAGVNYRF